jgi:aryl-alcohol dehydrogenase-like predicted oxidoreductase
MNLIIGTAKFGFKYGLNKKKNTKLEINGIEKILKKNSLKKFDTAMNYGVSEKIIGNFKIKKEVITKIKLPEKKPKDLKLWFKKRLNNSLKKLKVKSIYGLLIHDTSDILGKNKEFLNILIDFQKKNFISKLGISVYEIGEIKKILKFWKPDIIQLPLSVFDQRFLKNDFLKKIKRRGIEIHVRSCFLQGILLNSRLNIGNSKSQKIFRNFVNWCKNNKISQLTACLHFIKKVDSIDSLIIGFQNSVELKQIIEAFKKKNIKVPSKFINNEKKVIDPRTWDFI